MRFSADICQEGGFESKELQIEERTLMGEMMRLLTPGSTE
jgi:hypothetical protein